MKDNLDIEIRSGVVPIVNEQLPSNVNQLVKPVKETINDVFDYGQTYNPKRNENYVIAVPVSIGNVTDPYYIVYLQSWELPFYDFEKYLIEIL